LESLFGALDALVESLDALPATATLAVFGHEFGL